MVASLTLEFSLPYLVTTQNIRLLNFISETLNEPVGVLCCRKIQDILLKLLLLHSNRRDRLEFFLNLINNGGDVNLDTYNLVKTCSHELVEKLVIELGNARDSVRKEVFYHRIKLIM